MEFAEGVTEHNFTEIRSWLLELFAMLFPKILLEEYLADAKSPVATRPWVDGHVIALIDNERGTAAAHLYMLEEWVGDKWDHHYEEAITNLKNMCRKKSRTEGVPGDDGKTDMLVFEGHNHICATVLLDAFEKACRQHLGNGYLFCIPAIDEVVAFRPRVLENVGTIAFNTFLTADKPVSPHVFTSNGGKFKIQIARKWKDKDGKRKRPMK